ncbi:MAG: hypothetical protein ACI9HK_005980 [Pirellulaceae bacterium]|jgi:hypothetical protein
MRAAFTLILLFSLTITAFGEDVFPSFEAKVIDPNIGKVCYAVTVADVNGDSKPDIVAVSENRVLWYENPTWKPHVIIKDQTPRDNVCIAPMDIDGDGKIDFALGAGWTGTGTIHWLRRDASLEDPWQVHEIGVERWLHRMRWADVLGKGRPQLVISPLNATVGKGARFTAFEIPSDPVKERWPPTILNGELNRIHNHWHVDFDGKDAIDTLIASREGVHLVQRTGDGWSTTKLGTGATAADQNQSGAGEIKMGRLKNGTAYIATVEPMHGTQLVVYTAPKKDGDLWNRHVVDEGFKRGHALWTADLDGDGSDEIAFGHSDTPNVAGVNVYDCINDSATMWQKHVIDAGGMATEDLIVADFTGDGRLDIVAGGRSTHNVKLYVNSK